MKETIKLNNEITIDLSKLIESKLLVQANSGGGKSWALRRILEQSHGKVQHIILDSEGEFGTLREKYDYVLAAKGGDTPADPRSAALLARKLLELQVSAIIDLYELHPQERKRFVRLFLDALINAPKELWHPAIIVLDEAHTFAPEKGQSEAMDAVIGLCALGRKRGFGAILATQRISKLNKDAAAECNNKLIGRASQDIDMKRASDELGFTGRNQMLSLRALKPGEFYAFGPAISDDVQKITVGSVETTHPKAGSRSLTKAVPPTAAIKKVLGQLADLPQEAEKEARTVGELQTRIRQLETEKRASERQPRKTDEDAIDRAVAAAEHRQEQAFAVERRTQNAEISRLSKIIGGVAKLVGAETTITIAAPPRMEVVARAVPVLRLRAQPTTTRTAPIENELTLTGPEQRVIDAIAWLNSIGVDEPAKPAAAFLAGYTFGAGAFNNACGALRGKGLVEYRGSSIVLTDAGIAEAHAPEAPLTLEDFHSKVLEVLPGPEQRLLRPLLAAYPDDMSNEELAEAARYTPNTGGFNNPKGRLRSLELVQYPAAGRARASDILFPSGL